MNSSQGSDSTEPRTDCEFLTYRDGSVDCLKHRWSGPAVPYNRQCPSDESRRAEAAQEGAPLHGHNYGGDWIECTDQHEGTAPRAEGRRVCWSCEGEHDEMKHSRTAPGAEGLDVTLWREMIWLHHGHDGLYGDDGEMQCPHFPPTDFRRAAPDLIDQHLVTARLTALSRPSDEEQP